MLASYRDHLRSVESENTPYAPLCHSPNHGPSLSGPLDDSIDVLEEDCVWDASIHAATRLGARQYSRSNPPSLERQLITPVALTMGSPPFGGWS